MYTELTLNERLKNTRDYMGLTIDVVSNILGIPVNTLQDVESGRIVPSDEDLERLAKLYKHSVDFFLEGEYQGNQEVQLLARAVDDLSEIDREHILRFSNVLSQMT